MRLQFYQINYDNKVYSPSDITNLMKLYNELNIGCVGCDQKFADWQMQDVCDMETSWEDGNDAILVSGSENPHFVIFTCENPDCDYATSIDKPDSELKLAIDNTEICVIETNGMQYPLAGISHSAIHDKLGGNYTSLIMGGNIVMLINDLNPHDLPINPSATKIYTAGGCYKDKQIRGNIMLVTINEMNKLKSRSRI